MHVYKRIFVAKLTKGQSDNMLYILGSFIYIGSFVDRVVNKVRDLYRPHYNRLKLKVRTSDSCIWRIYNLNNEYITSEAYMYEYVQYTVCGFVFISLYIHTLYNLLQCWLFCTKSWLLIMGPFKNEKMYTKTIQILERLFDK